MTFNSISPVPKRKLATWPGESSARKARSSSLLMNLRLLLAQVVTSTLVLWWPWQFWHLISRQPQNQWLTNQLPIDLSCLPQLLKAVLVKQGETPCSRLRKEQLHEWSRSFNSIPVSQQLERIVNLEWLPIAALLNLPLVNLETMKMKIPQQQKLHTTIFNVNRD